MKPERSAREPNGADGREAARTIEFPRSLLVELATDTVRGDALEELLAILAEEGVRRQAERERRRQELHEVAS